MRNAEQSSSSCDNVNRSSDEPPKNTKDISAQASPLKPLDEETEEFLRFPPSNQQTLVCDWYKELVNKTHCLTEAKKPYLPQSKNAANEGNTGFSFYILCLILFY